MKSLAEVMEKEFKHVKWDSKLAKHIYSYQVGYLNSNREYLEFFGSNLLGVHIVRFKDSDVAKFFDMFDVDIFSLSEEIKHVEDINQNYKVSSDTLNLTVMFCIHKFLTSPIIKDEVRERAAYDLALIFYYRCTAAILSAWFRYPSDPKVAQMAYANLSNKYLIKKLGTWHKVMDYRANELVVKDGLWYKQLVDFNNDYEIVKCINDCQGRIRDLMKNYYSEFEAVRVSGTKISISKSTMLDIEGEEVTKEKTKGVEGYVTYILHILIDKHSFIKEELVGVIANLNSNSSSRMIRNVLGWMSDNYSDGDFHDKIEAFIKLSIIHSFYLLHDNESHLNYSDYPKVLVTLKNLYLSSRSNDKELMAIRELGENIVRSTSEDKMSDSLIYGTRTSIILYIVLRCLTGKRR